MHPLHTPPPHAFFPRLELNDTEEVFEQQISNQPLNLNFCLHYKIHTEYCFRDEFVELVCAIQSDHRAYIYIVNRVTGKPIYNYCGFKIW
jgi:hypothetical protein